MFLRILSNNNIITSQQNVITEQSSSFSIGLIFYYWDKYRDLEEIESFDEENVNDHGGHAISDLYVYRKYKNFKEEILEYKDIELDDYTQGILPKATKYLRCKMVKDLVSDSMICKNYDIEPNVTMSMEHLNSIILYTDYTDHCTSFSCTFRKTTPFESFQMIKYRNRDYWWMSRRLREVVEVFGCNREGIWNGKGDKRDPSNIINQLIGPFFTGLSKEFFLPQFNIRLCMPQSTSKRYHHVHIYFILCYFCQFCGWFCLL